ncbi:MAG: serine/threonine protein kinase [Proteobacteria bacterium]|nr:serine/threonine protein kinase [Pseudomonadota bacterium]
MNPMKMHLPYIVGGAAVVALVAAVLLVLRAMRRKQALIDEVSTLREMSTRPAKNPLQVGRYLIHRKLGTGGMAKVYLAESADGTQVALKIPDPNFFETEEHRTYFRQELSVGKKMQHPNLVRILDYADGSGGELPYIAMEYVDGVTLDRVLPKQRPLPVAQAAQVLHDVTAALEYAHNMGVVHRDIKPENIMLRRDGSVKVADFGIARDLWDPPRSNEDSNSFVGSPHYMSPEQISSELVDYRTDYYALGVVAFRMLTGYLPFEGETTIEVITRKVSQLPPPPSTYNPNLPLEIESMVRELTQREPERRPVSAVGIRKVFRKYMPAARKRHGVRPHDTGPKESDF